MRPEDIEECSHDGGLRGARATDEHGEARAERPVEEYRAAHIAGAVSLPLRDLESHLAGLPKDREVVAYCRGPYCVLAPEPVARLRARGSRAVTLGDGVAE